jgi:pyrimidine-nucleoside phosphorylase
MNIDFAQWVQEASRDAVSDEWIADLAQKMAASGRSLMPRNGTADVPSTGGPASLSTLLCPLFLRAAGFIVPKLGIPGRPAGGVDVMAQVRGYGTSLRPDRIERVLTTCGYAHFDAGGDFVPLDREFFRFRQANAAQALWPLVVASLLAKKLAASVRVVGLDVRVAPHGNFGADTASARGHAQRFIAVGRRLGIKASCYLTDATAPHQPFIGRGEALWALSMVFESTDSAWLAQHVEECRFIAAGTSGHRDPVPRATLARHFFENLEAQGSDRSAFDDVVRATAVAHAPAVAAAASGRVYYDLGLLRTAVASFQGTADGETAYPDLAGVKLLAAPGTLVEMGEPLVSVRCPIEMRGAFATRLGDCIRIVPPKGEQTVEHINA